MRTKNEKEFLREVAIFVKKERTAQGISRDTLAELANLSTRGIEKFETSYTNIGLSNIFHILKVLHIDLDKVESIYDEKLEEELNERIKNLGKHWNG